MTFRNQQFAVNARGEVEIQMVTYRHHPSALAASRSHQQEWFQNLVQNGGGPARTREYTGCEGADAGYSRKPRENFEDHFTRAARRTGELLDRRYRNYLMREGSVGEIFDYYSSRF